MRIKKIQIKNFKSLVDFELEDLKPFCAFVGPNASGKSNIFEALEFANYVILYLFEAPKFFGGKEAILPYNKKSFADFSALGDTLFDFEFADGVIIYFAALFSKEEPMRIESIENHNETEDEFQFLHGTIIRHHHRCNAYELMSFQFLHDTIIRLIEITIVFSFFYYFNSFMVRL